MNGRRTGLIAAVLLSVAAAGCTSQAGSPGATTDAAHSAVQRPPTTAPTAGSPTEAGAAQAVSLQVRPLAPGVADEASGIAAASSRPGSYFLVDDESGAGELAVVDGEGTLVTRVIVDGMSADNAEALSAGACGPLPLPDADADTCLYVGDIGDNQQRRADVVVHRAAEPDLSRITNPDDSISVIADEWHYTYPDGPHDAESMTVTPDGSLLLVTKPKNNGPHRMYRGDPGGGSLTFVREFRVPGSQRPMRTILTGNVATDLATSPGRVLLLTYDDVHEYLSPDPAADVTTFPDWPVRSLSFPQLPQAEGITGGVDGCGYVIASEAGPGGSAGSLGFVGCG